VIAATAGLNMKMDVPSERRILVRQGQIKWTAGGDGYFGIARTASAYVMNRDPSLTDTSI
jgi:hypothetical protein